MSEAERELLVIVAEGIRNRTRFDVSARMEVAGAGNNYFTGYSKSVTDKAAHEAQEGAAWLARLERLLARVKEESGL